jgi:tetratricopeptide (TPR) repeat protein
MKILGRDEILQPSSLSSKGDYLLIRIDEGLEEIEKCSQVIELYQKALQTELETGTFEYGFALYKQAVASMILANNGLDMKNNYLNGIKSCRKARSEGLVEGTMMYAESLISEAWAQYLQNELEDDSLPYYQKAIELFQEARTHGFKKGTHEYASTMVDEASILLQIARLGVEPEKHLNEMRSLLSRASAEGLLKNTYHNVILTSLEEHLGAQACSM